MKVGVSFIIFLVLSLAAILGLVLLAFRIRRKQKLQKPVSQIVISVVDDLN